MHILYLDLVQLTLKIPLMSISISSTLTELTAEAKPLVAVLLLAVIIIVIVVAFGKVNLVYAGEEGCYPQIRSYWVLKQC